MQWNFDLCFFFFPLYMALDSKYYIFITFLRIYCVHELLVHSSCKGVNTITSYVSLCQI